MNKLLGTIKRRLNLHDQENVGFYVSIALVILVVLAVIIRKSLVHNTNGDYWIFASWYDYVKLHGLSSFKTDFSNYNPPYTYFLYLITLLPLSKIVAIKGLLAFFDLILAGGVYLVVRQLKPGKYLPVAAGIASLFLPTVLANGVFWGQFDQLYVAFVLFSLYYLLKDNSKLAWLYFGIAIAIKLQAIFFLPVLILMSFKRIKLSHAVYGIISFVALTFLPVFAGRSIKSILDIYVAQTGLFSGNLTLNAANLYQWIPNSDFSFINSAGIYMTGAVLVAFFIYNLIHRKYSDRDVMMLTAIMLFLLPFILPQMHERYFFPATIASFVLVFIVPRLFWVALAMQLTVLFSYIPFLFSAQPPIPMTILAVINLGLIIYLIVCYARPQAVSTSVIKPKRLSASR